MGRPRSDVRAAGRRGPHPARRDSRSLQRGADHRCARRMRSRAHHEMHVRRIHESPRVTRPYTDEQWAEIDALGQRVDDDLAAADVRLTMGGEPTFVSIDDMDGAEWNLAALGPKKRERAGVLVRRLKKHFAPGGVLHCGQGKWYPGESLPRWALGLLVASRRRADVERGVPAGRRQRGLRTRPAITPALHHGARRPAGASMRCTRCRRMRTSGTTCGGNAGCRSTSIR